jgi:hypothetical protein
VFDPGQLVLVPDRFNPNAAPFRGSLLASLWDEENTPRNAISSTTSAATIPNRVLVRSRLRADRSLSPRSSAGFLLDGLFGRLSRAR